MQMLQRGLVRPGRAPAHRDAAGGAHPAWPSGAIFACSHSFPPCVAFACRSSRVAAFFTVLIGTRVMPVLPAGTSRDRCRSPVDTHLPTLGLHQLSTCSAWCPPRAVPDPCSRVQQPLQRSLRQATALRSPLPTRHHDPLTGLANTGDVLRLTQGLLDGPPADRAGAAVLVHRHRRVKRINDNARPSRRRHAPREHRPADRAATPRMDHGAPGGDEFVVVVAGPPTSARPSRPPGRFTDALVIPVQLHGRTIG